MLFNDRGIRGATCLYTGWLLTVSGMVYATCATSQMTINNGDDHMTLEVLDRTEVQSVSTSSMGQD